MNALKLYDEIKQKIACGFGFAQMLDALGITLDELKQQAQTEHKIMIAIFNRYKINIDEQTENKTETESEQKPVETVEQSETKTIQQENTEQKAETIQETEKHKITLADIKKKPRKNSKK